MSDWPKADLHFSKTIEENLHRALKFNFVFVHFLPGTEAQGQLAQLADKAQHYTACVQKVEGHLIGLDKNSDDRERSAFTWFGDVQCYSMTL